MEVHENNSNNANFPNREYDFNNNNGKNKTVETDIIFTA